MAFSPRGAGKRVAILRPSCQKKGVIGIGVLGNCCDESRRFLRRNSAALSFVPPFLAARAGSREARRFAQAVPGTPTCSSCRPQLALGAAVSANRTAWRPFMAHVSPRPESSGALSAESLALQACDDIDSLRVVQRAYACLEKLIVPQRVNDAEEVYSSRTELGALVSLVNDDLRRRIEMAENTIQLLRTALSEGDAR